VSLFIFFIDCVFCCPMRQIEYIFVHREQPVINTHTVNLDCLQSLPHGTLGREYADWLRVNVCICSVCLHFSSTCAHYCFMCDIYITFVQLIYFFYVIKLSL